MPDILTAITGEQRIIAPDPAVYAGLVRELRFDPFEPWSLCGCPDRYSDSHLDDCWLSWIAQERVMHDEPTLDADVTQRLPLPLPLSLPVSEVDNQDE